MGFVDRLSNSWRLFKTSFSFIKRDKTLIFIPVFMLFSMMILFFLFVNFVFWRFGSSGFTIVYGAVFLLVAYVWSTFLAAMQSWMVYEVAQGKDTTMAAGFKRAFGNIGDIVAYALVFFFITLIINFLKKEGGRAGEIGGGILQEVSGVAGKLILPAMIVTERNFWDALKQLGQALKAIPEIAFYEVGSRPFFSLLMIIFGLIGVGFMMVFGVIIGISFILIMLFLLMVLSILVDQIYYTLLYLTLIEKKKVKGLKLR